jgi:hypothetical protein
LTLSSDANPAFLNVNDEELAFEKHHLPWRCMGQFDTEHEREDDMFAYMLLRRVTAEKEEGHDYL